MSSKGMPNRKRGSKKNTDTNQSQKLPNESLSKIRQGVPREEGFYFYSSFGNPTGAVACTFDEFCENVKSSPTESVEFHLTRGDFENWIRFLGDEELANRIHQLNLRNLRQEELCQAFLNTIEDRRNTLQRIT